jgi:hypothetical protein
LAGSWAKISKAKKKGNILDIQNFHPPPPPHPSAQIFARISTHCSFSTSFGVHSEGSKHHFESFGVHSEGFKHHFDAFKVDSKRAEHHFESFKVHSEDFKHHLEGFKVHSEGPGLLSSGFGMVFFFPKKRLKPSAERLKLRALKFLKKENEKIFRHNTLIINGLKNIFTKCIAI